jgi:hypothetical protein
MRNPIVLTILNSDDAIINKQNQPSLISTSLRYPILALTRQAEKNATATRQSPRLLEVPSVCCLLFAKIQLRIFFLPPNKISQRCSTKLYQKKQTHISLDFSWCICPFMATNCKKTDPTNSADLKNLCALRMGIGFRSLVPILSKCP